MGTRDQLQQFGQNNSSAEFEREEIVYKDTVFVNPSGTIVDTDLFVSDSKDSMYRNAAFPITSHAYSFTHLCVHHNLAFTVTDPKKQNSYLQHFEEDSEITFQKENKILGIGHYLWMLTKTTWHDLGAITATGTYIQPAAKFADWYKFEVPIQVGAGAQFKVGFKAAKGLTALAYSSTDTPYIPNAAQQLTCSNAGHWIQVYLRGFRWLESRA
jgi:hypothetical protein